MSRPRAPSEVKLKSLSLSNTVLPDREFKVILCGSSGSGKTSFIKRHIIGLFLEKYFPTQNADIHPVLLDTNKGKFKFNLWDIPGRELIEAEKDQYLNDSKCAIIFFDVTKMESYEKVQNWYNIITSKFENIPIIIVGNKVDLPSRVIKARKTLFEKKYDANYFDISIKSNYQIEKPFLCLLKRLTGDTNLKLEEKKIVSECTLSQENIKKIEEENLKTVLEGEDKLLNEKLGRTEKEKKEESNKNQSQLKYYLIFGVPLIILLILTLIFQKE